MQVTQVILQTLNMAELTEKVVRDTIETPIKVLIQQVKEQSKEELIEEMNALAAEMIKLQYKLRTYSVVEWYNTLDDLRKHLHDVFEENRDFFKACSKGDNWMCISTVKIPVDDPVEFNGKEGDTRGPYYIGFFKSQEEMNKCIDKMEDSDTEYILCLPIFKSF